MSKCLQIYQKTSKLGPSPDIMLMYYNSKSKIGSESTLKSKFFSAQTIIIHYIPASFFSIDFFFIFYQTPDF